MIKVIKFKTALLSFGLMLLSVPALAQSWANIGTTGTLNNNELCYTDGTDIICDAGITVNDPSATLIVPGTVSATAFVGDGSSLTNVLGTPAGSNGRLQFNNAGVMGGAPLVYNDTYDKFYARGGLNNYIVNHSTGGTYAGRFNFGTANPGTYEGALHLAVAGYDSTADLRTMIGVMMIGNRDSVFDATPIPMVEGSYLPGIGFAGHTTTSLGNQTELGATIHSVVDGAVSYGVLPTAIVMNTGTGGANLEERMRIQSDGNVGIGLVSPNAELDVSGTVSATAFVGDGASLTNIDASAITIGINDLTDGYSSAASQTLYLGEGIPASGSKNIAIGHDVLSSNTTGIRNVAIGSAALTANSSGTNNIALGDQVLWKNSTGSKNFAAGYQALFNATAATGSTAIGYQALRNGSSGADNHAIGESAMYTASGSGNVGIGSNVLRSIGAGSGNIGFGTTAGYFVNGGDYNIAMGYRASFGVSGNTSGSNNISIGARSNELLQGGSNNIAIGVDADVPDLTGSNQMNIGGAIYGADITASGLAKIGINVSVPTESLEVSGTVSATAFVGDGSGLTGVGGLWTDAGDYINRGNVRFYNDTTATIDFPNNERGFFFHEGKGALRVGRSYFAEWDDVDVGTESIGFGNVGRLTGSESFGVGDGVRVTGNDGIAMGYRASVTGSQGVAIGSNSTASNLSFAFGPNNVSTGRGYLFGSSNTTSANGTQVGVGVGNSLLSHRSFAYGASNYVEGYTSGTPSNDSQGYNFAFGVGNQVTALNHGMAIGTGMIVDGSNSMGIGVGYSASGSVVTDTNTLAIMGASGGVGIGLVSPNAELDVSGTVSATAFVGDGASLTNIDASAITIGIDDLTDGSAAGYSVFLGDGAGNDDGGPNPNTGIGYGTQRLTTGYGNTSLGGRSLRDLVNGNNNVAIGYMAQRYMRGDSNVALGSRAGHGTTGNATNVARNVLLGSTSGSNLLTGGDSNVFVGFNSGSNVTTGANNIMIGATTKASAPTASNELNIGNAIYGADISQSAIAKIGINVPVPTESLEVSGTVSATAFVGDGSSLTGITSSPAGNDFELQFNNADVLDGSDAVWNDVSKTLRVQGGVSADSKLEIVAEHPSPDLYDAGTGIAKFSMENTTSSESIHFQLYGYPGTSGIYEDGLLWYGSNAVKNLTMNVSNPSALVRFVVGAPDISSNERMRITNAGVSIGNIAPSVALEVSGTVSATAFVGDGSGLTGVGGLWTDVSESIQYEGVNFYKEGSAPSGYSNGDIAFVWNPDKRAFAAGKASYSGMFNDASMGDVSFAFGDSAIASGARSFAFGTNAEASANSAIAINGRAQASYAIALNGIASAQDAISMARYGGAYGVRSVAIGASGALNGGAQSYGLGSVALGSGSDAYANYGIAIGISSSVSGTAAAALTPYSRADGTSSVAMGKNAFVSGNNSMAFALADVSGTEVVDNNTLAILGGEVAINQVSANAELDVSGTVSATAFVGDGSGLTGVGGLWNDNISHISSSSVTILNNGETMTSAGLDGSFTAGLYYHNDKQSLMFGDPASARWNESSLGTETLVIGDTRATGSQGISVGQWNDAGGLRSFALGQNVNNQGDYSVGVGTDLTLDPAVEKSLAFGESNRVYDDYSMAFGRGARVESGARYSLSFGYDTVTGGTHSLAFGNAANAGGASSYAFGTGVGTTADYSMIIGLGSAADISGSVVADPNTLAIVGASGGVGIGITSPNVELDVSGSIEYTGTLSDVSDRRLKQNIQSLDDGALAKIDQIDTVSFEMKDNPSVTEFGVIAQDFEKVYPELVNTADDDMGTKSVNYMGLIAPMVKAMQELKAEVETLKAQNAEQQRVIDELTQQ